MNPARPFSIRLVELYKVFSNYEKRELSRFLASPYFNRDKHLPALHQFMSNAELDAPQLKSMAWRSVYKNLKYNDKRFRYLVSDLIEAIEEFIFVNSVRRTKYGFTHILDEYFSVREAISNKTSLANRIKSGQKGEDKIISPEYFLEQHYLEEMTQELHSPSLKQYSKYITEHKKTHPSGLDLFYLIEKLRQICIMANDNNLFGVANQLYNQRWVLELALDKHFNNNPFVKAYWSVYAMLTHKDEQYYFSLKEIIDDFGNELEDKNLAELFIYARNFCIGKINAGHNEYFNELFDLYEQGLSKRVLLLNGEINERNYKNIVTTGLRIGKHQWVFDFINEYRYKLNRTVRENAYSYNLANYYFHTHHFAKALQHLQRVSLADLFYGLDARTLILKCYYELDEYEAFLNAYYSFRVFVMRKKNVSEQHRSNYLNFLRIAKKLMNLRPRDKKNVLKIREEIKNQKALADKSWLAEKIKVFAG